MALPQKKEICLNCEKTVFVAERLVADEKVFHKGCFRCTRCNNVLKLGSYASMNGMVFCKPCFKKNFFAHGNYSQGFGKLKPQQEHDLKSGKITTDDLHNFTVNSPTATGGNVVPSNIHPTTASHNHVSSTPAPAPSFVPVQSSTVKAATDNATPVNHFHALKPVVKPTPATENSSKVPPATPSFVLPSAIRNAERKAKEDTQTSHNNNTPVSESDKTKSEIELLREKMERERKIKELEAKEKLEKERKEKEEKERREEQEAKEKKEREAREKLENDRKLQEVAAKEKQEKEKREREAKEQEAVREKERKEREAKERLDRERKEKEAREQEAVREKERKEKEARERLDKERREKETKEKQQKEEVERKSREEIQKKELETKKRREEEEKRKQNEERESKMKQAKEKEMQDREAIIRQNRVRQEKEEIEREIREREERAKKDREQKERIEREKKLRETERESNLRTRAKPLAGQSSEILKKVGDGETVVQGDGSITAAKEEGVTGVTTAGISKYGLGLLLVAACSVAAVASYWR